MKSLKELGVNMSETEYHAMPVYSYSFLAKYARQGFSAIKTFGVPSVPSPEMVFGSLVDTMLTRGMNVAKEEYLTADTLPTPSIREVLDTMASRYDYDDMSMFTLEEIGAICDELNYQPRYKLSTKYDTLVQYEWYYNALKAKKTIVSNTDWNDACDLIDALNKNEITGNIFSDKNTDAVEYVYQAKFITDVQLEDGTTVKFKFMPDELIVDHAHKTITPVDLKTSTVPAYDFADQFVRMRYDIQAHAYTDVLRMILDKDEYFKDFTILDYLYVDISRSDKIPLAFSYSVEKHPGGFSYTTDKEYKYKDWKKLLEEVNSYMASDAILPSYVSDKSINDLITVIERTQ